MNHSLPGSQQKSQVNNLVFVKLISYFRPGSNAKHYDSVITAFKTITKLFKIDHAVYHAATATEVF